MIAYVDFQTRGRPRGSGGTLYHQKMIGHKKERTSLHAVLIGLVMNLLYIYLRTVPGATPRELKLAVHGLMEYCSLFIETPDEKIQENSEGMA